MSEFVTVLETSQCAARVTASSSMVGQVGDDRWQHCQNVFSVLPHFAAGNRCYT